MAGLDDREESAVATIDIAGSRYRVSCRVAWDGIEYVGRLWFVTDGSSDHGVADRSAIPGRNPDEVRALASRLSPDDLARRLTRAQAEKRRFIALRRATDDIISRIRYLNQVAVGARSGLLDAEGAAAEIELVEAQLHEMVSRLRDHAGVEG